MNWRRGVLSFSLVCAVVAGVLAVVDLVQATEDTRGAWTLLGLAVLLVVVVITADRRR